MALCTSQSSMGCSLCCCHLAMLLSSAKESERETISFLSLCQGRAH